MSAGGKITVFTIDSATGKLSEIQALDLSGAGPIARAPNDDYLYLTSYTGKKKSEQKYFIATLKVNADGTLKLLQTAPIVGRASYLKVDKLGGYLTGAHYQLGLASVWQLDDGIYRGELASSLELEPKSHSTQFSFDNKYLLVPATGPNKVFINTFDAATGKIAPHTTKHVSGPTGDDDAQQPRHLIFSQRGKKHFAYTTMEQEQSGVAVWKWDPKLGTLEMIQNINTMPEQFEGRITTADLHLTPDHKFLYISSRNGARKKTSNTPTSNEIIGFSVSKKSGKLKLIGRTKCELIPRSFAIDDTGKFMYVAGQGDARLGVYAIAKDGSLSKVVQYETGLRPTWVECFTVGR